MRKREHAGTPGWLNDLLGHLDEEMRLRGFTPQTRRLYRGHVRRFYLGRGDADPVTGDREIRDWMLHLLRDKSHSYASQALSALRLLHKRVLHTAAPVSGVPRAKKEKSPTWTSVRNGTTLWYRHEA